MVRFISEVGQKISANQNAWRWIRGTSAASNRSMAHRWQTASGPGSSPRMSVTIQHRQLSGAVL